MNILLNCESLTPPLTGIGHYTRQLILGLCASAQCDLYGFIHGRVSHISSPEEFLPAEEGRGKQPGYGSVWLRHFVRRVPGAYTLRSRIAQETFRKRIKNICADAIYHEPNYILKPFEGICVATVHDLSCMHYPEYHPRERVQFMEREFPKTLKRADHFITVSEYVKNEMVSFLGVAPEKITAIHHGVGSEFHPRSTPELTPVLSRYNLKCSGYLLAVATLEPRKNLDALLEAYMRLSETQRKKTPLVLAGGKGWCSNALEARIRRLEDLGHVRTLGYVPDADLPFIYAGAHAFAFPSHYEGFGLPPLEAMASGVPVLVADNSAMSEVVAHAGIKVNAHDGDALFAGLEQLLCDEQTRSDMACSGLERAQDFSWGKCIHGTLDVYKHLKY